MRPTKKPVILDKDPGPHYEMVKISGKQDFMNEVFDMVAGLMCMGNADEALEKDPKILNTVLSTNGVRITQKKVRRFVPWHSIASMNLSKPACGKPCAVLLDCIGRHAFLPGVTQQQFETLHKIFCEQIDAAKSDSKGNNSKIIVKKGLTMTGDGISFKKGGMCGSQTHFVPWGYVDAAEMEVKCCGGAMMLITEQGQRIKAMSTGCFGGDRLKEVWQKAYELKYGRSASTDHSSVYFAGKKGGKMTCSLSDVSLHLVTSTGLCSSLVREFDLDAITGCDVVDKNTLNVHVVEAMHIGDEQGSKKKDDKHTEDKKKQPGKQTLRVKLTKKEDAKAIAADIIRRAEIRQKSERSQQ